MIFTQKPHRRYFFLIALLFFGALSAQRPDPGTLTGSISGTVTDESGGQSLEFATIAIHNESDSSLVTGGITDINGNFSLKVKPGNYYIKVQFISYGEKFISGVKVGRDNMNVDLGSVSLAQSEVQLDEVTVQAERTQMELQLDKKVYNIGKDLSNLGGSASDLLGNLPSVDVDVDGNVSLRGSENVQILIDGKPSNLIGLSGSGGLQQLQGNLIERVEVITNPSARYDAEGGAGIINIILKKDRARGFNGSFQVQTGAPQNHGASVNVNYRTGWINWFVNYGISYRESPGQGYTNNAYNRADTTYFINQTNDRLGSGVSNNVRFGSDIYLNELNIITLAASYRNSDEYNETEVLYDYLDETKSNFGDRTRIDGEDETDLNWEYSLNYSREFKRKKGQKFTFDASYQNSSELEESDFTDNTTLYPNTASETLISLDQLSSNDNGEERVLLQSDYIHPFGEFGKVEGGFRYTYRNVFNDYFVESDSAQDGNYEEVTNLTNDFNFDEKISAAYFIISNRIGSKITWQLGTRIEHTNLSTLLEQTGEENNQNYLSLFPSAFTTYAFTDELSLQLSYSRRISRPRYRDLNPFTSYSDPLNLYQGNPNLQPQFVDSYELGILKNTQNASIYTGVYHRHTDGAVQRIQTEIDGITYRMPENLAVENSIGVEMNITRDFGKKFRTSGNFNFYNQKTEGQGLSANATTFSARLGNNYRNDKLFDAQLNIWYRAPEQTTQGERYAMASVDFGISKDVMKKNGTISMNARDLFNTRKYRGTTVTDTFTSYSSRQWRRGPTFVLSFTYRLNQKKQRQRGERDDDGGFDEF